MAAPVKFNFSHSTLDLHSDGIFVKTQINTNNTASQGRKFSFSYKKSSWKFIGVFFIVGKKWVDY